jgi:hypothetical protein
VCWLFFLRIDSFTSVFFQCRASAAGVYGHGNASDILAEAIIAHRGELMGRESLHIGRLAMDSPPEECGDEEQPRPLPPPYPPRS